MRVLLTSPWIPAEWVRAHGLEARGIWFVDGFRQSTPPLTAGLCAFAESVVQFAATQPDDAVVFATACDQLRRGFDAARFHGASHAFLFNLPATQTPAARQMYRAELERLGRFLLKLGGSPATPEKLRREMVQSETTRRQLLEAAPLAAARSFAEAVARFHANGAFSEPAIFQTNSEIRISASTGGSLLADSTPPETHSGLRTSDFFRPSGFRTSDFPPVSLALVGGPLSLADWNLFDAIETAGGRVVLNATLTGERSLSPEWDGLDELFEALVTGYFDNLVDVFQRPNTRLYSWLKPRLLSRQARGIVLWHFTGCDLWRAEFQTLRDAFALPVLWLEADAAAGLSPRDIGRLAAFLETLQCTPHDRALHPSH